MPKYYAVRNGRSKGTFSNWNECKSQVEGYSGAEFKSFKTQAEANAYMSGGSESGSGSRGSGSSARSSYSAPTRSYGGSYGGSYGSPYSSRSSTSRSSTSRSSTSHTSTSTSHTSSTPTSIYTDGSSLGNGKAGSRAGYGVYFGDNDPRNSYGAVKGPQTNNAGELTAIKKALDQVKHTRGNYIIKTDSSYSLDSVTKWANSWERNGWKTSSGSDVLNKDLIVGIRDTIKQCESNGVNVSFQKVKGHSNLHGNEMADRLARRGAQNQE